MLPQASSHVSPERPAGISSMNRPQPSKSDPVRSTASNLPFRSRNAQIQVFDSGTAKWPSSATKEARTVGPAGPSVESTKGTPTASYQT